MPFVGKTLIFFYNIVDKNKPVFRPDFITTTNIASIKQGNNWLDMYQQYISNYYLLFATGKNMYLQQL